MNQELVAINKGRRNGSGGFTLMEVAIAILVMAVGVVAVFSLMATGLDANALAVADTQAALFADSIFRGLRAESVSAALNDHHTFRDDQATDDERWDAFWGAVEGGSHRLQVCAPEMWSGTTEIFGDDSEQSPDFKIATLRKGVKGNDKTRIESIENHTLRYQLQVEKMGNKNKGDNRSATLSVWEGKFGPMNVDDALVFYSEFYNPGDL